MDSTPVQDIDIKERFDAAVNFIKNLPPSGASPGEISLSNDEKLKLYGLYKQATEGSCKTPQPGWFDVVGKYKWEAWKKLGNLDRVSAMKQYLDELLKKADTMPESAEKERFVEVVTPLRKTTTAKTTTAKTTTAKTTTTTTTTSSLPPSSSSSSVTPKSSSSQQHLVLSSLRNNKTSSDTDGANDESSLAQDVDSLKDALLAERLRMQRLEALLSSSGNSGASGNSPASSEVLSAVAALEETLAESRASRDRQWSLLEQQMRRVEERAQRAEKALEETQKMVQKWSWMMVAAVAVAGPLVSYAWHWISKKK